MRIHPKYKNLSKQKFISLTISKRIFNFKKSKWFFIQKRLKSFIKKKIFHKKKFRNYKKKNFKRFIKINFDKKYKSKNKIIYINKFSTSLDFFKLKKFYFLKRIKFFKKQKYKVFKIQQKKNVKSFTSKILQIYKTNIIRTSEQWFRVKYQHKKLLNLKSYYFQKFDNTILNKNLKKNLKKEKNLALNYFYQKYLVLPNLNIKVLLWELNLFKSTFETKEFVQNNPIILNFKQVKKSNILLKKGDILFLTKHYSLRKQKNLKILSKLIYDFIEIEHFSNSIVVLKSLKELSYDRFFLMLDNKSFDIKSFKDYYSV